MSTNDEAPKTALPVELWEKVVSMRAVYWKVTTVKHTMYVDPMRAHGDVVPDRHPVRYLREVPVAHAVRWPGSCTQIRKHLEVGEYAVYGPGHPSLGTTGYGQDPVQVGDPLWQMHTIFYENRGGHDDQSIHTTTLVGAVRVGGPSLKRRRVEPAAGP